MDQDVTVSPWDGHGGQLSTISPDFLAVTLLSLASVVDSSETLV